MAAAMLDPILDLDLTEVHIAEYTPAQNTDIPPQGDMSRSGSVRAEGPSRTPQAASGRSGATERAHTAAVMDTDVRA